MWEVKEINSTTFNVVSDFIGLVVAWLLLCALSFVYPQMVWTSIKQGNGVNLEGIISPPISFWDAAWQFFKGRRSRPLIFIVFLISIVATLSHTLADVFLEFKVVEVGSNQVRVVDRVQAAIVLEVCLSITNDSLFFADSFSWLEAAWCIHLQVDR